MKPLCRRDIDAHGGCGFSILDPSGFIGDFDRLPVASAAAEWLSLFNGSNSLLLRKHSLFLQK
jgi:hypothetical protein